MLAGALKKVKVLFSDTYLIGLSSRLSRALLSSLCTNFLDPFAILENYNGQILTMTDNKTVLQALALINDCNKYKMDLTTNGVVIADAMKFVSDKQGETNHIQRIQGTRL